MYKSLILVISIVLSAVYGKRHGHAFASPVATSVIAASNPHHKLSDSEILDGLSRDTDVERSLLRRTSKTFTSLNNKLKSILRNT
jgi:hypothetical protein